MSVFFWKCSARIKLVHRALFFLVFFLARGFSIIFSYLSWWFWKMVYIFCFAFFFFWCNNTHSDFSYTRKFCVVLSIWKPESGQVSDWGMTCFMHRAHPSPADFLTQNCVKSEVEILGVILRILSISLLTEDREQVMLILSVAPFLLGFLSRKLKWDC